MRLGVDRVARLGERASAARGSLPLSSGRCSRRPTRSASVSSSASSQIAMQRSRISARVSSFDEGAAAGRDHPRRSLDQPGDHPALAVAEMRLAEALENLGDAEPRRRLDLAVGVDEGQAEPLRQPPPDGRLARAHQPDERDRLFRGFGRVAMQRGLYRARRAGAKGAPCVDNRASPPPAAAVRRSADLAADPPGAVHRLPALARLREQRSAARNDRAGRDE